MDLVFVLVGLGPQNYGSSEDSKVILGFRFFKNYYFNSVLYSMA